MKQVHSAPNAARAKHAINPRFRRLAVWYHPESGNQPDDTEAINDPTSTTHNGGLREHTLRTNVLGKDPDINVLRGI